MAREFPRFKNRHVLITGAASGIGFEIAKQFAAEGAVLSLVDVHVQNLQDAVNSLQQKGAIVNAFHTDISNREEVAKAVLQSENILPIDILVNNAGIAIETPFLAIEEKEWKQVIDVNLNGSFYMAQEVCRCMARRRKGVVINMASKNGLDGEFGYAHYNASKAAIIMLTKTMALELAHLGIRVNAVCPGYIQTPMSEAIDPPGFAQNFAEKYIPMNRPGKPEEAASLFLFLASDDASFITGQVFIADGGQLAGQKAGNELLTKIRL
ncbi:MAG: SDR family NAD(P)-dependent oxidoreductase [Chitinophagaceae bacterium]